MDLRVQWKSTSKSGHGERRELIHAQRATGTSNRCVAAPLSLSGEYCAFRKKEVDERARELATDHGAPREHPVAAMASRGDGVEGSYAIDARRRKALATPHAPGEAGFLPQLHADARSSDMLSC